MAESYNEYVGDGVKREFDLSFSYLSKEHVFVSVGGVLTPFTWINDGRVQLTVAPAVGVAVKAYRRTPDTPLVVFTGANILKSSNLNTSGRQSVAIAVEARDASNDATGNAGTALENSKLALTQSAQAIDTADAAVVTANSAEDKADAAVATAGLADTKASASVVTANAAASDAATAFSTANAADVKATTAISTANSATSTANTALTNASSAVTAADEATADAATALYNSSTALTQSTAAISTANAARDAVAGIIGVDGFPSDQIDNQSVVAGATLTDALNILDIRANSTQDYTTAAVASLKSYTDATFSPIGHGHVWSNISGTPASYPPSAHTHDDRYYTETEVNAALATKASLASPAFTGSPTAPTAGAGTNTTQVANTAFVKAGLDLKASLSGADFTGQIGASGATDVVQVSYRHQSNALPRYGWRLDLSGNLLLGNYNHTTGAFVRNIAKFDGNGHATYEGRLTTQGANSYLISNRDQPTDGGALVGIPKFQAWGQTGAYGAGMFCMQGASDAYVGFYREGAGLLGRVVGDGGSGIAYVTTSDYRLKNILGQYSGALDAVKASKVYSGTWYSDQSAPPEPLMLAHEIAEYAPRAVYGEKDATADITITDNDGNDLGKYPIPEHQTVDYSKLVPLLFAGLKELTELVEQQAEDIRLLKAAIQSE